MIDPPLPRYKNEVKARTHNTVNLHPTTRVCSRTLLFSPASIRYSCLYIIPSILRNHAPELFSHFATRKLGHRDSVRGTLGGYLMLSYEDSYCERAKPRRPFSRFRICLLWRNRVQYLSVTFRRFCFQGFYFANLIVYIIVS